MKRLMQSQIIATGLAMFSMFFGSGNLVFPLTVGRFACDSNLVSIIGFLITAVGVPFLGLAGVILFNGNYKSFLYRIGRIPGFILMSAILLLIGPFGVLPRCIILSFDAISNYLPAMPILVFSLLSAVVIFLFTIKESKILNLLGFVLSPLLLVSLGLIVVFGLIYGPISPICTLSKTKVFLNGLLEGYKTFDLFAAIFFSSAIFVMLKKENANSNNEVHDTNIQSTANKKLATTLFYSSMLGAFLLSIVYIGMSYISAKYSIYLAGVRDQELLVTIARQVLGSYAGLVVALAVALACLTTAIALAAVSAEFLEREVFRHKINYMNCLLAVLVSSVIFSTLEFDGLMRILVPFLKLMYPSLILLSALNLFYKLFNLKIVKIPFYTTLVVTAYFEYGAYLFMLAKKLF